MSAIYEMQKNIHHQIGNKMKKFCSPLVDHFGISNFYHIMLTESGQYAASAIHQDSQEWLFSGPRWLDIPYLRSPKNFRGGIHFTQAIQDTSWAKLMDLIGKEFNIHAGLQITTPINGGIEAFGFTLPTSDPFKHMALLNELPFLKLFIKEYKKEFQSSALKDNLVDIASLIGPAFYETPPFSPSPHQEFLKEMRIDTQNLFSKKESEVIYQLLEGCSAPEIGVKLSLSTRTIEHYIERIKARLNCSSKSNLIQKLRDLESIGYIKEVL